MKKIKITPKFLSEFQLLTENIEDDYFLDYYINDYTVDILPVENAESIYIQNTIDVYCSHHDFSYKDKLLEIIAPIKYLAKRDVLINFHEKAIYKEIYKILYLIDCTKNILSYIQTSEYKKYSLLSYKQDKREFKRDARRFKKMIVGSKTQITYKKEPRLKWYLRDLYARNKKIFNFFLSSTLLTELERVKIIRDFTKDEISLVLNEIAIFTTKETSKKDIIKSLAILLHYEFKTYLKIKDTKSKELVSEIVQYLFEESYNDEEFNKNIYIRSSVGMFPIFGASKKGVSFNLQEVKFIKDQMAKFNKKQKPLELKTFKSFIDIYYSYAHTNFLQQYPVELFRINPKYSHLENLTFQK